MKVIKLYQTNCLPNHYVVKLSNGSFAKFNGVPFREITPNDLTPINYYIDEGNNSKEASEYLYALYGLTKE